MQFLLIIGALILAVSIIEAVWWQEKKPPCVVCKDDRIKYPWPCPICDKERDRL